MTDRDDLQLDRFWDALALGQTTGAPPDGGELLRTLHTLHSPSPPGSARERARQRVFDSISVSQENDMTALTLPASLPVTNGHSPGLSTASARPATATRTVSRRQFWLSLAVVLALLAGLSGWFAYDRIGGNDSVPAVIPAAQDATPTAGTDDWPMYRGNPGRTGAIPGTGPKSDVGAVWSVKVDGSAYRSPIVVGDTAYVGTSSGTLYALDADTGESRWTFTGDDALEITPAYQDGIVYVPSLVGTLYAIDADTGEELWHFAQSTAEFATPTFGDGLLFVGSETNNALYGIDPKTGDEVWHFDTGGAVNRGQAYADGVLYSGSDGGILYALNAKDGSLLWQYDAQQESIGTPAVADGVVYTTSPTGQLILVDAGTGKEIKRIDTTSTDGITPPTIGNGLIYIGTWQETIDAIDPEHEQVIWSYPTHQTMRAALALVDGAIYGVGMDNTVFALDAASGAELWTYETDGAMDFGPTVANGMVYVSTEGGAVIALGEGRGTDTTPAAESATPAVAASSSVLNVTLEWEATGAAGDPMQGPSSVKIGSDGNVYVIDEVRNVIEIFAQDGTHLETWGESGSGPGQFNAPGDIGFDADGNIYVFDTLNNRVQKFAPDRTFIKEWGTAGSENGQMREPHGAVDPVSGRIYVAEFLNNRIQVFDLDGNYLDKWGSRGNKDGQFQHPSTIGVDGAGNVYVTEDTDGTGARIQVFDPYGTWLATFGSESFTSSWGIAFDAAGNLYSGDVWNHRILVFDPDFNLIGSIESVEGASPFGQLYNPTFDDDGFFYIADLENGRILKLQLPPIAA